MTAISHDTVAQQLFENQRFIQSKFAQGVALYLAVSAFCFKTVIESPPGTASRALIILVGIATTVGCAFWGWGVDVFIGRSYSAFANLCEGDPLVIQAFPEPKWTLWAAVLLSVFLLVILCSWVAWWLI